MLKNKKKHLRFIIAITVLLLSPIIAWWINTVASWFKTTSSVREINAHWVCKAVRHTGSSAHFVPTRSAYEWSLFRSRNPSGTIVANCPPKTFSWRAANNSLSNTVPYVLSGITCGPWYTMSSFKVKSNVEQNSYASISFASMNWWDVHYQRIDKHGSNSNMLEVLSSNWTSLYKVVGQNWSSTQTVTNTSHSGLTVKCSDHDKSWWECAIEVLLLCTP